jgi:hypothetical protein
MSVARVERTLRVVELLVVGVFVGIGVVVVARGGGAAALIPFLLAAIAVTMFELRLRGFRRSVASARASIAALAKTAFDAEAEMRELAADAHLELLASNPAFARSFARRAVRFDVEGTIAGERTELGTAVVPGRDFDVRISYARVDGPQVSFRAMSRGPATSVSRLAMKTHPVKTGDAAFDHAWVVDGDERVCRAILDEEVRSALMRLHAQLGFAQVASVESTPTGVVVRRPGELGRAEAEEARALAVAVRDRARLSSRSAA